VTPDFVILTLVIITALGFDFTNGFHDTANAMATSIATKALRPKTAVALSGILNLIGAFLSVEVALTVTNAVVKIQNKDGTPKDALTADGGQETQCGWLKDKFGVSWQIVPVQLEQYMNDPDPEKVQRVTQAMLQMVKIDVAGLQAAYEGVNA
jgi:hypothetical protein